MINFRRAVIGAAAAGFLALTGAASAMPVGQLGSDRSVAAAETGVQKVRWVCGPYGRRCVWRPNYYRPYPYYGYGRYYAPRPRYYGYYGYGPRWRRW
jgi:hypothetical protein